MVNNISILKNITILYAEDEDALRDITLNILKGFTKKQYVAKDGLEGLKLFEEYQDQIDLIITDVNMPNMNGLEMIKKIKLINPNIPIIVTTAFSNTEYLLEAIDIGVDKYILKPIDMKKLLQVMGQSLLYHELKDLYIDKLTNLPNRNKLKKDLFENENTIMALINIDKFSNINDLYGEMNGDELLVQFSLKLKNAFPNNSYRIYRIEADKFGIVTQDNSIELDSFKEKCVRLAYEIEGKSIQIAENEIDINVTIGIAKGIDAYKYSQRVITYAKNKLEQVMVYDDSFNIQEDIEENIKWVKKLKNAFNESKFQSYFQPIVNSQTQEIYKYEALLRYIDEDGTAVSPVLFLGIAKKAKLYPKIITVMLKEAFKLIKAKNKRVAVNISYDDIISLKTRSKVYTLLENNKEFTHNLEFEILESEQIEDFGCVIDFISDVKKFGCSIGVDDFGAGYSNFNMLTNLDIDFVKIDGSLIRDIDKKLNQQIIVNTISNFAKEFGFKTVAEFVSSEEIYNKVKKIGVDYCQGYYFDKPISFDEV
ncbi:MAG: EAL domain-containing protein [Candidatus Marinarcus sp.]|uniref:EAL domain-containing response regulator n=1 Tax=Candidatus Marinarcus sp. TaxID=3100987 RepID=UPI003B004A32